MSCQEPFDFEHLLDSFRGRAVTGIEEVAGPVYRRSLAVSTGWGIVELEGERNGVRARLWLERPEELDLAIHRCRLLLDLDAEPSSVNEVLGGDPVIGEAVKRRPGLRVPGTVDGHELAVRAVIGQQITLKGAAGIASQLVAELGTPLPHTRGSVTHSFPQPAALSSGDPSLFPMPAARRRCIQALSAAVAGGDIDLDAIDSRAETHRALLDIPGIGPWTAGYVAIRALRDPDVFLGSDLGVRHALALLGTDTKRSRELAERWRPFRSYATQHLWAILTSSRSADRTDFRSG